MKTTDAMFNALSEVHKKTMGLRAAARKHSVNYYALRRRVNSPIERGRMRSCLNPTEETMITKAVLEFADRGTPLSLDGTKQLVSLFVARSAAAEERRRAKEKEASEAAKAAEERRQAKEKAASEAAKAREEEAARARFHEIWLASRSVRVQRLRATRLSRREHAKRVVKKKKC